VFLNGLCESTHGMGDAGSLSLVSIREEKILSEVPARTSGSTVAVAPLDELVAV
jgi:lysine/ornithine N-monooxygenase